MRQDEQTTLGVGTGRRLCVGALALAILLFGARGTQDAVANGDTRTITIYHAHTKEQETVTFKRWGSYDSAALQKLNWLLRDWRLDEATRMDPMLFDLLWEVQRSAGSTGPVHVVSAYRSSRTNEMLRRRSRGVAKNSQHTAGRALDFNLPDVSMAHVRDIGLKLQRGGVGYYPRANNPWVHLDTGGVRHWPKVTREHLARLFPDGRTVHIPRDGKPLEGFEAARQIIEARGGSVSSGYIDIAEGRATGRSLFQILFGGGEADDEGDIVPAGRRGRTAVAQRGGARPAAPAPSGDDTGSALAFLQTGGQTAGTPPPAAGAIRPRDSRPALSAEPVPDPRAEERKREEQRRIEVAAAREAERKEAAERAAEEKTQQEAALAARRVQAVPVEDAGRVTVALPPRRPSDLATETVIAASANVPLPPGRPRTLLADNGLPERALETGSVAPREPASAPFRTAALPEATRGLNPAAQPAPMAYAAAPAVPVAAVRPAPAAPAAARQTTPAGTAGGLDRKGLNILLAGIEASRTEASARVQPASVRSLVESRGLTGRFEQTPKRAETAAFTGTAIRPLGSGFRRSGD